jgi:uncharacterized protein (TIGR02246 family)
MKRLSVLMGVFFLGMTVLAQQGGMSKPDLSADEMAIKEISGNWLTLDRNNDIEGIMELFDDQAVVYSRNQQPSKGKEAIRQYFKLDKQMNPKAVTDWKTERVEVASSGDLAVEYGSFTVKNSGPDGNGSDQGNFVTVYRKIDGKWKIISDIGASTKPAEKSM